MLARFGRAIWWLSIGAASLFAAVGISFASQSVDHPDFRMMVVLIISSIILGIGRLIRYVLAAE